MTSNCKLLKGKTAVITGCLKGIGKAALDLFAVNGADLFACCQFETEDFKEHLDNLAKDHGVTIIPVYFDLSNPEQIKAAVKHIQSSKKSVDILVNIAGMTQDALFHMITMDQMKKVFEVNFFAQMFLTQYITKLMLRNKKGSVINISSISALDGNPGQLSYSASKAALIGATKTLSAELAPNGIRVNAIAPGVIKTEMTEGLAEKAIHRQMSRSSLKHMGLPAEVASAILFLASDLSSYITGQIVRVDGGIG
jgi:3-oxoacyl-[acyl-carrier protein] reductase